MEKQKWMVTHLIKYQLTIKVGVEDIKTAEELYNRIQISKSSEEFFVENYPFIHLSSSV